ncbi:hypothetical protein [Cellulomonas sp. PS-H5]|uniref:hypothetical protein n=1 Tax=Cellulomonas sp. PS-H5 TaxID=2820400 RepID=UPI001C501383|nr:hypothetical protein [Cellulomonas sp. PS-H5]MBW0255696.1 hypothetical protein [Cellulomonas sp. PS-H5]
MTDETHPDLPGLTRAASDIISVRRVFGEPYEHGSTLVVPVAKVMGWHGVAGAHADARVGIRGGHGGPGGPGAGTPGPGEGGDAPADGGGAEQPDGPRSHGGDGGPGSAGGGTGGAAGGTGTDATEGTGRGAHAEAPVPEDGPWTQSGPGAPAGAVGSAGGGASGPGGPVAWAGRGGGHGGPGHGGRLPFLRGPLWPFGSGRPGGRGVGAADAGGYATRVKPLGVFVISDEGAQWQPALDLNRIILGGQVVGAVATVALAWSLRRRRRLWH